MAKFRRAESYYGKTGQSRKNQRGNLVPGGPWQKKRAGELRLVCWWQIADLESKQFIFEGYEKKRDIKDVPKGELKDEKFLNDWWDKREGATKEYIYWSIMNPLTPEEKAPILKHMQEYVKS